MVPSAILIDNHQLKEVDKQSIIFDSQLQWGPQLSSAYSSVSYYLNLHSLHRKSLSYDVLMMLIESLFFSMTDYALPVWGLLLNQLQIKHLQRLQNRNIHVTKCLRKYNHVSEHRQQLNWLHVCKLGFNLLVPCFVTTIIIVNHTWFSVH